MKKFLPSILLFAFWVVQVSAMGFIDSTPPFVDVSTVSPYFNAANYLKEQGIINGYDDGAFKPYQTINRAEFVKIIVGMMHEELAPITPTGLNFKDIDKSAWYAAYLKVAVTKGLIKGYADGTFKPDQDITFAEAAKILANAKGLSVSEGAAWYSGSVSALEKAKAIPPTIDLLNKKISRGEMAQMIYSLSSAGGMEETQTLATLEANGKIKPAQITFDACGKPADYKNQPWYGNFREDTALIGLDTDDYINGKHVQSWDGFDIEKDYMSADWSDMCYSPDAQVVVIAFYAHEIYRYDIKTRLFYPAKADRRHTIGETVNFHKRIGNSIPFTSEYGDAGCVGKHEGLYDFVQNVVTITKDESYCVDDN